MTVVRAALVVLLIVALLLALLWVAQRKLVYFPDRSAPPPAGQVLPGARDVTLTTADGLRLTAWLVPGTPDRKVAVLVAPGNAGHREGRAPLAAALAAKGFTVLLLDYRGYGGNPGDPTEQGLARDVRAARDFLVGPAGFPPERLLYFGESLGGGVVTGLAVEHPPAGLILRSPFTDLPSAGQKHYPFLPVRLLARDRYPVADRIAGITVPTVVIYGTGDRVVPPELSAAVAGRAAGPVRVVVIEGADHNDAVLVHGPQVTDAVAGLL
ncbi:alpha/beta hydrolase [Paractinoplanes rishiriensis]|uniref:Serine aminopeptidase S33 domain-containing protein n=1 Tax=Paractinoplanes rishiriensis TaxID=1050105 RepID=A0A919K603_9ACTN|nr:alpha/beta fold hydrolase [Actinoplanes rishiriensis]GIE99977.1 hypothetical protein Ari01nite_74420 [Actinoplanes rishiriensis]